MTDEMLGAVHRVSLHVPASPGVLNRCVCVPAPPLLPPESFYRTTLARRSAEVLSEHPAEMLWAASIIGQLTPAAAEATGSANCAKKMNVVALHGSLRNASCNGGLLRYAMQAAATDAPSLNISHLDISKWPLFNSDLIDAQLVPSEILDGIQRVYDCDAVLIVTPEYNFACSPVTTNAVAWLSKAAILPGTNTAPLAGKPCGLLSAGGGQGGMRAQVAARASFIQFLKMPSMAEPSVAIKIFAGDPKPFDMGTGELTGEAEQRDVASFLASFQAWLSASPQFTPLAG